MGIASRLVICSAIAVALSAFLTTDCSAVEIPKPVINIPKPNIPRPTINVPRPTINVPRPNVTVHVPKPTVNVPRPVVSVPKVNVPKPVANVPKVDVPRAVVNVPKVEVHKPVADTPKVDLPKSTVQVTIPKTVAPPSIVSGTPKSGRDVNAPKSVDPVIPSPRPIAETPRVPVTTTDPPKVAGPDTTAPKTPVPAPRSPSQANVANGGSAISPSPTSPAPASGSNGVSLNGNGQGNSINSLSGSSSVITPSRGAEIRLPNGTFGKAVLNPDGSITVSNNLGTVTLTKQQMNQVAAGDMSALKPLVANGNNASGQGLTQSLVNSKGNVTELRLPNGTFGKVVMNSDGTITLSNNVGSVKLTKQQMNQLAAGDTTVLKPLMANSQNNNQPASGTAAAAPSTNTGVSTGPMSVAQQQQGQGGNNGKTYGTPPSNICPVQQCSSTVDEGGNGVGGKPFYEVNFKYSGDTPPPPPPGMHYMESNMTGCGGGTCTLFLQFNSQTASTSTPAIQMPSVSGGGRQPIYVQDANGVWHKSYWFAPPADVLANYGPLSEASSQPVLPFGFYYPNGPPPNAVFADDSNPNSSKGSNNPSDDDPPNPKLPKSADDGSGANGDTPKGGNQQMANASPAEQQDTDGSEKGKSYTPGSWDDPNCTAGCYDPKLLNDIGIQPQFADGTLAPPTAANSASSDVSLVDLKAQVDKNTQAVSQQLASASSSTDPEQTSPMFGGMVNIGGCSATGNMECGGQTFTYDSSGIHQYATDPANSSGTPTGGITGYLAWKPQEVANGDSITFGTKGGLSVSFSPGNDSWIPNGVAIGLGVGPPIPSASYTRGKLVGYSPWFGSAGQTPNLGSGHLFNDPQGNLWWQSANGQNRMVYRVTP
ncbi:hypothetical protein [Bradyrhizobium mercantei]|uniref:hypothetical protein n=1 Tax=Bradyrhizobium mercantei TaxID=1904807 RepID=UPI0011775156|nr:hypothetical protein [Bradyrhizobium mercantei]